MIFKAQIIKILALILLFLVPQIHKAQSIQFPEYSYQIDKNYAKSYWTCAKKEVTFPARWRAGQWVAFTGVLAGTAALYLYDDEIRTWIQKYQSPTLDKVSSYGFKGWGNGLYPAALFGSFYIYGLASQDLRARQIALGGLQAFLVTGITTQILKQLTHRHRPYQDNPSNPEAWDGPFSSIEYTSFPSGHTSTAFALAALISSVYNDKAWVGILSYTIASGVAWSRVYENKHWPSDVFFGAALGIAIGKTVYHVMQGKTNLSLGISDNGGVSLVYHIQ